MPSTFSTSLRLELVGDGEQSGVWGQTTNNNLGDLLEQSITGTTSVNLTAGNVTLTSLNGVVDQARSAVLSVVNTSGVTRVITIPNVNKNYTVINPSANIVQVKTASGTAFDCPATSHSYINCNGVNVVVGRSITALGNQLTSSNDLGTTVTALGIATLASPAFTGVPTAPTAAVTVNNTQIATTAFVRSIFPAGMITMWSGSIASIPAGWLLCDGTSSTPDLRDRFIVGAGSTYAVNATGGANTVTLTTDQIPSHTHTGSGTSSGESVGHTHTGSTGATSISHTHTGSGTSSGQSANHSHSGTTNSENANHTHAFNVNSGLESNDHGHSGSTDAQGAHTHELWANDADGASGSGNPDAFFVASGGVYVGPTRSAGTHSHTVTTGGVSANHFHNVAGNTAGISANHQHTFSTGNNSVDHTHTYSFTTAAGDNVHIHAFTTGANSVGHNHTYSFTTAATGGGLSHENRPPYFALAYIMKT